jgi:hypothetical protein
VNLLSVTVELYLVSFTYSFAFEPLKASVISSLNPQNLFSFFSDITSSTAKILVPKAVLWLMVLRLDFFSSFSYFINRDLTYKGETGTLSTLLVILDIAAELLNRTV